MTDLKVLADRLVATFPHPYRDDLRAVIAIIRDLAPHHTHEQRSKTMSEHKPGTVALAWHDVICVEAEDCRDRAVHSIAQTIVTTGIVDRFLDRLDELEKEETPLMIDASVWGTAAGSAPQYGPLPSPRQHRYAPTFEPEPRFPWLEEALCAEVDTSIFFPEKGESSRPAKRICGKCSVVGQCLADALASKEMHGIRGGLSAEERKKLIKARKAASAAEVA